MKYHYQILSNIIIKYYQISFIKYYYCEISLSNIIIIKYHISNIIIIMKYYYYEILLL